MKRNGKVVNAREAKKGRGLLRWGKTGMHYAEGEYRHKLMKKSRELLSRGHVFAAQFFRGVEIVRGENESGFISQTIVSELILAVSNPEEAAVMINDLQKEIAERIENRDPLCNWTYDDQTQVYERLEIAIGVVAIIPER